MTRAARGPPVGSARHNNLTGRLLGGWVLLLTNIVPIERLPLDRAAPQAASRSQPRGGPACAPRACPPMGARRGTPRGGTPARRQISVGRGRARRGEGTARASVWDEWRRGEGCGAAPAAQRSTWRLTPVAAPPAAAPPPGTPSPRPPLAPCTSRPPSRPSLLPSRTPKTPFPSAVP